jgi:hypothetical protein
LRPGLTALLEGLFFSLQSRRRSHDCQFRQDSFGCLPVSVFLRYCLKNSTLGDSRLSSVIPSFSPSTIQKLYIISCGNKRFDAASHDRQVQWQRVTLQSKYSTGLRGLTPIAMD